MSREVLYVIDEREWAEENSRGLEYWDAYLEEILSQLGLSARSIRPEGLTEKSLEPAKILFTGKVKLSDESLSDVERWVRAGGVLVAFGTDGLERSCGIELLGRVDHPDAYEPSASLQFGGQELTQGLHSPFHPGATLPIFSDYKLVRLREARELAVFVRDGTPAITSHRAGEGRAFYFAFSLPKSLWLLHQGRPSTVDTEGDGYFRTGDMLLTKDDMNTAVLYADELVFLLERIVSLAGLPTIEALPPKNGQAPDAVFYWGGDDEFAGGVQVKASEWMQKLGLPYHINVMWRSGNFALSVEEAERIRSNGHEVSIHLNFIDGYKKLQHFKREELLRQVEDFKKKFGFAPGVSVMHWVRWSGWADTARWLAEAGCIGDNSFFAKRYPPLNPVNSFGFGSGTAFPFFFRDDWRYDNARVNLVELPITAYEPGYNGSELTPEILKKIIAVARYYALPINMFYHTVTIMGMEGCRKAVGTFLKLLSEEGLRAKHTGLDELARWWKAREESEISVESQSEELSVVVRALPEEGLLVRLPPGLIPEGKEVHRVSRAGVNWRVIYVEKGEHEVKCRLE